MRAARSLALGLVIALVSLAAPLRADDASLRARLAALGAIADDETSLAHAASAALDRASHDRARLDEAAALRAERIAEASLALLERRRARHDAETSLAAARAERDAMEARLEQARAASASDARERARLDTTGAAP